MFLFDGRINMKPENLENAVVYLADAKAEFRRLMQDPLRGYSFREVRAFPGHGEFKNALPARLPLDLIIVDTDLPDGDVFETIARMRNGNIGYNPFVPVIVLAWNTEGAVIGNAIDSGWIGSSPRPFPRARCSNGFFRSSMTVSRSWSLATISARIAAHQNGATRVCR